MQNVKIHFHEKIIFPKATGIFRDKKKKSRFYFKKLQLYQKTKEIYWFHEGPFSSMISRYMTGQAWIKFLYYANRKTKGGYPNC